MMHETANTRTMVRAVMVTRLTTCSTELEASRLLMAGWAAQSPA